MNEANSDEEDLVEAGADMDEVYYSPTKKIKTEDGAEDGAEE